MFEYSSIVWPKTFIEYLVYNNIRTGANFVLHCLLNSMNRDYKENEARFRKRIITRYGIDDTFYAHEEDIKKINQKWR